MVSQISCNRERNDGNNTICETLIIATKTDQAVQLILSTDITMFTHIYNTYTSYILQTGQVGLGIRIMA